MRVKGVGIWSILSAVISKVEQIRKMVRKNQEQDKNKKDKKPQNSFDLVAWAFSLASL